MRAESPEFDLSRPLGGRIGLVLLGAAALAGLVQGLGSILWNGFALAPPPPAQAVDVNPLLRAAPPAPKPAAPAAEAANAATAEANKAPEPEVASKNDVEAAAPNAPGSSVPPYGPPANTTAAPVPVLPVQPVLPAPAPAPAPEPEAEPPL
jgi:hypothetical protein